MERKMTVRKNNRLCIEKVLNHVLCIAGSVILASCMSTQTTSVKLLARDANITSKQRMHNPGQEDATIQSWHRLTDRISWSPYLEKGNYLVNLYGAEPYFGGVIGITIGNQQQAVLIDSTQNWTDFKTYELGVVRIAQSGETSITLQGLQFTLLDKNGKKIDALPDVRWLSLTPTKKKATFASSDITAKFKGKRLFNGKSLKGWTGNNREESLEWFRVEDGAIVAGSMECSIPRNEFLRTTRTYENFELRLKFKMKYPEGKGSWNGGVQFRSVPHPQIKHEMVGYQADIISWKWGALYDESRRNQFLGTLLEKTPQRDPNGWNSYIIRCEGARIRIWLNGQLTIDYTEPYATTPHPQFGLIPQNGYIALQIHQDQNPCEAWYKDIEIEELK